MIDRGGDKVVHAKAIEKIPIQFVWITLDKGSTSDQTSYRAGELDF